MTEKTITKTVNEEGYRTPAIRIKNAWLLHENASKHLHELWGKDETLADNDWMERKVGEYTKAWRPYEQKILQGMTETLGCSFRQNIIDIYIAPWFQDSLSWNFLFAPISVTLARALWPKSTLVIGEMVFCSWVGINKSEFMIDAFVSRLVKRS